MKKYIVVLLFVIGCSETEKELIGCTTGIPKGETERVLIRCSTKKQFLAGNNTSQGGISYWNSYTGHKFEECSNCD